MNYDRIYEFRFKGVDKVKKQVTWKALGSFFYEKLGKPKRVLDPAAGFGEFINNINAEERWAVDMNPTVTAHYKPGIKSVTGDILKVELPRDYFDAVFVSNFLEHLNSQFEVADFLEKMNQSLRKGGRIAIMGPNFKYCSKQYFDFADHTVVLSELGVAEHIYGAGFEVEKVYPRFLPLSFRGGLPVNEFLVKTYLNMPMAWPLMGKQFLVIGKK